MQRYLSRLKSLADLSDAEQALLVNAYQLSKRLPVKSVFPAGARPLVLASGWAGLIREVARDRYCILRISLPGEIIHAIRRTDAYWQALTPITVLPCPSEEGGEGLMEAYRRSQRIDVLNLEAHAARLGAMSSIERYLDFLVDVDARLALTGHGSGEAFHMPMSQGETGQFLGMTSVHINRMRRQIIEEGVASLRRGEAQLLGSLKERSAERQKHLMEA